jgi:prepilin-type N-terminal cleavage/methylation domain-containing protein
MPTLTNRKQNGGFTLAELLVVIAIIGVLVTVSIPIFAGQLDKAKAATDKANVRSAKAAAVAEYLTSMPSTDTTYYYDAARGTVTTESSVAATIIGYGKSTLAIKNKYNVNGDMGEGVPYEGTTHHIVSITISSDGNAITANWELGTASGSGSGSTGSSGGGSTASGSISGLSTLSISTWDSIKFDKQYGVNVPAGTLVSEGSNLFLFSANSDYYGGDLSELSLADNYNKGVFAGRVIKITNETHVYTETDFLNTFDGKTVPLGTIAYYQGKYVCQASGSPANKDNMPIAGHTNWVEIK